MIIQPSGAVFSKSDLITMKALQFLKETKAEMRQVTWPSRNKALLYALVVILFSVALGYLLGGFDTLFQALLKALISN